SQIVYSHDGGGARRQLRDGSSCGKSSLETQVAGQYRPGLEAKTLHRFFVGFETFDVRFQPRSPSDKGNAAVAILVKVIHNLLDTGGVVNPQVAGVSADGREIEKGYGDHSASEFVHQLKADFRSHDGDAADFVFHHALGGLPSSARIVIGVTKNGVVA